MLAHLDSPDLAAAATLPVLASISLPDASALDTSATTIREVLLPPITRCIARTAHSLAASHHKSIPVLLSALDELRNAFDLCSQLSTALWIESPGAEEISISDCSTERSVIKAMLWALEVWTNLLLRVKDMDSDGPSPPTAQWLECQVNEVEVHIGEACHTLFVSCLICASRVNDIYRPCSTVCPTCIPVVIWRSPFSKLTSATFRSIISKWTL